jgi:predicted AlkP superfamily phosphohydrolase/phosphomutase
VKDFRTRDKDRLRDEIDAMTRTHFAVVRHFLEHEEWDYFQFVEIGLDRVQHGFWKYHDPEHVLHEPDSPYRDVIRDYYRYLDDELGSLLELLTEETIVLVVSDHGAQRLDGGFCVNEWLVREGLLVLRSDPERVTPFSRLDVDWGRTRAWSEGGSYARVFLNVEGREPEGTIAPSDYEPFRDELKTRLEATTDPEGRPLGTLVFKPEEIYRTVRNVASDLIAHFGALSWRSIGGVGYPTLHVRENDTGPDDCNHAQHGVFVLAAPNNPVRGEVEGAHLLNIAPTLLELGGYDRPPSMQNRSLVEAGGPDVGPDSGDSDDDERTVRDRLSGLGYIG